MDRILTHFQDVLARKGSPSHVSIAQYGIGTRIQLSPAPAISAISCSVCEQAWAARKNKQTENPFVSATHNEGVVMIFQLIESATGRIGCHKGAECPFIHCLGVLLEQGGGDN